MTQGFVFPILILLHNTIVLGGKGRGARGTVEVAERGEKDKKKKHATTAPQQNLLKKAAARLTKPKLVACVKHWRDDWEKDVAAAGVY